MIKGAIFDVDGTLLDSMPIWDNIGADYLRSIGYEPREDLAKTFKTFSLQQAARYYQDHYGVTRSVKEIVQDINDMIEHFYQEQAQLKRGVAEFLYDLDQKGVAMCIATATDRPLVESALKRCGILHYFSAIFTCSEVGSSKNEPYIFRVANQNLGTSTGQTVVFEDAFHAAQTAVRDGFPVVAVYDAAECEQEKLTSLADCYLKDFADTEVFWKFASVL